MSDPTHPRRCSLAIVGAGPHALTLVGRLAAIDLSLLDDVIVIDPSSRWMSRWCGFFEQLEISHLRSPMVHHPHPDVDAILRHPDLGRGDVSGGIYQRPSQRIFMTVVDELIEMLDLADRVTANTVRSIEPTAHGAMLELDQHAPLHADSVVVATNDSPPRRLAGMSDGPLEALPRVGPGDATVVVGGGLTAAQVVDQCMARGAQVTLVTRRPLVSRAFDVDPGWMGPKHLAPFSQIASPTERVAAACAARGGGTMPEEDVQRLRTLVEAGRLVLIEGCPAVRVHLDSGRRIVELIDGRRLIADHVLAPVGSQLDVHADPLLGSLVTDHGLPTAAGLPVLDAALRLDGLPIHVMGRLAMTELGPAAGNLSGARRGAARIAAQLAGDDPIEADPGLSTIARRHDEPTEFVRRRSIA